MKKFIMYSDGAARGNPGPASAGAFICDEAGQMIAEVSEYLGETTNNVAEYQALIFGLKKLVELGAQDIEVRADSELLVKQMNGQYRVKHPNLIPLFQEAKTLLKNFSKHLIRHVRREQNKEADALANRALDLR